MKKILGVVVLSLVLFVPAQMALAASAEEKVMTRLEEVEKELKTVREMINKRMGGGKKMSDAAMSEAMMMLDSTSNVLKVLERRFRREEAM
jgi:hypothetical protein